MDPAVNVSSTRANGKTTLLYEKSSGIIPFRRGEDGVEYLLLHSGMVRNPDAAWEFPKGSMETGEEEPETARRELTEETGIVAVTLLPDFRDRVEYTFRRRGQEIEKTVVFFLGQVADWSVIPSAPPSREHKHHPKEDIWFVWGNEQETMGRLFHPGMRKLFTRASFFLHEHDRIERKRHTL